MLKRFHVEVRLVREHSLTTQDLMSYLFRFSCFIYAELLVTVEKTKKEKDGREWPI